MLLIAKRALVMAEWIKIGTVIDKIFNPESNLLPAEKTYIYYGAIFPLLDSPWKVPSTNDFPEPVNLQQEIKDQLHIHHCFMPPYSQPLILSIKFHIKFEMRYELFEVRDLFSQVDACAKDIIYSNNN